MPRSKSPTKITRPCTLGIRVSPAEKRELEKMAQDARVSVSALLRNTVFTTVAAGNVPSLKRA